MEIKEIEYCKLNVSYSAPIDVVAEKRKKAIKHFKQYKVPGFRKGKTSDEAIKSFFKEHIEEYVKKELINHAHDDILFETKIRPIGQPQLNKINLKGSDFSCEFTYLKKPDFEISNFKGIEVVDPHIENTADALYEKYLQELRTKHGEMAPYSEEDKVKKNDKVTLTYSVNGESISEGMLYSVGSETIEPGFDASIIGMSADDEREFVLGDKTFKVKIHMGLAIKPAPLDDELAKKIGIPSFAELQKAAQATANRQITIERNSKISEQIKNKLIEENKFECPLWLITMEAQQLASKDLKNWQELSEEEKKPYFEPAEKNVRYTLILDSIREQEKETAISDDEAFHGVKDSLLASGLQQEQIQNIINNGYVHGLIAKFKNDYTQQWLIDNAKVIS